jgi:hypothetical protein
VGNRLLEPYSTEAAFLLEEGATPSTVNEVTLNNNEINLTHNSITTTTTFSTTNLSQTTAGPTVISATWENIINTTNTPVLPTLEQVLTAGNTATGASALIGLTNSDVGYTSNPQLTLNNSNATAGATTGVPSVEYYKSGRNAVAGDIICSQFFNAKNSAGTKTEFAKIEASVRNTASENDDGSIAFSGLINGVEREFFRVNGADSENNMFLPLDMNNQSIKSSTGNLALSATASSGNGDITATAKRNIQLNAGSNGNIILDTNSIGDLQLVGTNLEVSSASGASGKWLRIKLNGTYYRIALEID